MASNEFTPWPCTEFAQYPIDANWNDTYPQASLSRYRYTHILNATRSFFLKPELSETYHQLRNYAFQQGAFSNANALDLEFFYSALSHDYPFFLGHKQAEIHTAFHLDANKYQGMDYLKASHFDIYRVERALLGFAALQSLTNPSIQPAFVSFMEMPHVGDIIFARLIPIGLIPRALAFSVVEPWDTVDPKYIDDILATFRKQFEAFQAKFPDTTTRAFMKIAAYHVYESIQAKELIPHLNQKLKAVNDFLQARTVSYIFTDRAKMPKLTDIPGAKLVKDGTEDIPNLATAPICEDKAIPETLREAIISREDRTLEVTLFMHDHGDKFIQETLEPCFKKAKTIEHRHILDDNETYRALRHLSLK